MISKNQIKYYSSLLHKKQRKEEGKFLVEGPKLILEALNYSFECELIIHTPAFGDENDDYLNEIARNKIPIEVVKKIDFDKMADTKHPQEIIGIFFEKKSEVDFEKENLIVALETINDPGNLGTIIRNCDWFGIKTIIVNSECAEIFSPKVIRASAGSLFHLKIIEGKNFTELLNELKKEGYELLCADINGENIFAYEPEQKSVLILANEANGPSNELLNVCTKTITVPKIGKAESLNVASASAILLSQLTK